MGHKKSLKRNLLIALLAGSAALYTMPIYAATSVIANNALPTGGEVIAGGITIPDWAKPDGNQGNNLVMNIQQSTPNGIIKWDKFDVGGSATVNFNGIENAANGFNTLNYVNGGNVSQIYGTINATNGNIYVVNPAGVQIGNSAQINVGSLYVSNAGVTNEYLNDVGQSTTVNEFLANATRTNAELMSLGNINATNVTFEGDGRIVIDSERIKDGNGAEKLNYQNINIKTDENNTDNIIIGYDAYDETLDNDGKAIGYKDANQGGVGNEIANVNGNAFTKADGYMWVEDVDQLQAINTNLNGNYALRNSIDATATSSWNENKGFNPIGLDENGKVISSTVNNETKYGFTGKFDGIDYNIFGLTINRADETNVGLFGVTHDANINNVTLVGGSITGSNVVGSVVGAALGNTHISNAVNSAAVTGNTDVGGIVGYTGDEVDNVGEDGTNVDNINTDATFTDLINTGAVTSKETGNNASNAGGLIGYMYNGTLNGNSYNLGNVEGSSYNVGGLVGHAVNSTIGNASEEGKEAQLVYNRLDVTGEYNVGGIVGNMEGSIVQNAENSATVTVTGNTTEDYTYHSAHYANNNDFTVNNVNVANVGGIAGNSSEGSSITDVTNTGDVSSNKEENNDYYDAGNVGGIVGKAVDTNITNATNRENDVRGAHNVGGVAGYFGNSDDNNDVKYTITNGINDGGDIMATGARNANDFVQEWVRAGDTGGEQTIVGNMGGVVGYLDGDNVYITSSANRGTVHSLEITGNTVSDASKASNTGGIVGKIDRDSSVELDDLRNSTAKAAVSDSYNTGDVRGYMGVGGIVGMMYNGEVAHSYNNGAINTTRQPGNAAESYYSVNMGGIVGDTTEGTNANAVLYDVYNKGQIGDETYTYYARHVGGIVGRLSGTVDKAYNTGAIYNSYNVVGGIAGWFYKGEISNSFNTGNITVLNNENTTAGSQVGGIAGAVSGYNGQSVSIKNAYNLGTLRSFQNTNKGVNYIGGIIGKIITQTNFTPRVTIQNVYTTGNLYAQDINGNSTTNGLGSIYGRISTDPITINGVTINNAYYITPEANDFENLYNLRNQHTNFIAYRNKDKEDEWKNFTFSDNGSDDGAVDESTGDWRIYEGTTPILNAFLPNAEDYFSEHGLKDSNENAFGPIQYGTAYDPLLTIIKTDADTNLQFNWQDLKIKNDAGLAVYGGGLTLEDFKATGGTGYFGGIIYADGSLKIDGNNNDIGFGSTSQIYGSDVSINTAGNITIYGNVIATGNMGASNINITSENGDIDVYGTLTTGVQGATTNIAGIAGSSIDSVNLGNISDKYDEVTNMGERYSHKTNAAQATGDITITAGTYDEENQEVVSEGNVNLYFGNQEQGLITTGGNLTVEATGDVYVDSDLDIGKDLTLTSHGADSEVLLTLTNIGKVQANRFTEVIERALNGKNLNGNREDLIKAIVSDVSAAYPDLTFGETEAGYIVNALINYAGYENNKVQAFEKLNDEIAVEYMHDFMHSFDESTQNEYSINLNAASGDAKLTVDMWDYENNVYDFEKYDTEFYGTQTKHTFVNELDKLNFKINGTDGNAADSVYVEVSNAEQLKGIQNAADDGALGFNFALKNDINASDLTDYVAIGTGNNNGFTGTFDGRGNRIIGLTVDDTNANAGIFSTIGATGVVKNLNIYSGNFTGTDNAGAVAGVNNGRIENITAFGNTVTASDNAGGIVGVNNGSSKFENSGEGASTLTGNGIYDVESTGSVIAGKDTAIAGGLVGTNAGALGNSFSNSAVTVETGIKLDNTADIGLGGVVGVNTGEVQYVDSLGVTNGGDTGSSNIGGVIGINNGNLYSAYNESIVSGSDNVGGIIGKNVGSYDEINKQWTTGVVSNIVNATSVTGIDDGNKVAEDDIAKNGISDYVGGLVGSNSGSVTNGRNNGTITGTNYVGGMVGNNAENAQLTDLVNDSSASITGEQYVGGIAGSNAGTISATDTNLINRGSITGNKYVGGVAGVNEEGGTITNTISSIALNVKTPYTDDGNSDNDPSYFGGVVGQNSGIINGATNTSSVDVAADKATYVGGIIGENTATGELQGTIRNEGTVSGLSNVGGIIGENKNAQLLYNANDNERLQITNTGSVSATEGGAAGIFYNNNITGSQGGTNANAINNADITNSGTVTGGTGEDSVTGGLFGYNSGNITNSTLTNSGTVTGGGTVGGLIGINTGNIEDSSLKNLADITVNGNVKDVGGLIGKNTGTITGGRNEEEHDADGNVTAEADSYYKYQIYNNGTITVNGNGSNIGGLIGNNADELTIQDENGNYGKKGSLTAGYNTGAINAESSTNVGGIAGSNSGTIDQVFNTVMTADGNGQAITGGTNVGGLVGNNEGTLTNAYNTTEVKVSGNIESAVVGNAVGTNSGVTISNIYATNTDGNLIGSGNEINVSGAYSFSANDNDRTNIKVLNADNDSDNDGIKDRVDSASYDAFDFDSTDGDKADWKNYDGYGNPLLKVFLTKLTVDADKVDLVYNAGEQDLNIGQLIEDGIITAPEAEALQAHYNTLKNNELGESDLLANTKGQENAGTYDNWLYSGQIADGSQDGSFNPNNLGYDIEYSNTVNPDKPGITIDKANIQISLDDIYHIYGNVNNVYSDSKGEIETTYKDSWTIENESDLSQAMKEYIGKNLLVDKNTDKALNGDKTQNVGDDYDWSLTITLGGDKASNYTINGKDVIEQSISGVDKSHVIKADLTITAADKDTTPGVMPNFTGTVDGLTNGDTLDYSFGLNSNNNGIINVDGNYSDVIGIVIDGHFYELKDANWAAGLFANYEVTYNMGDLTVSSELLPDLPDNWPSSRWDYLFNDNPFDRNRNFRERKAEVNFVDGGMEI